MPRKGLLACVCSLNFFPRLFPSHADICAAPSVLDESDDTGSSIYILNRLGRHVNPDGMINRYESSDNFRCFVVETNPSSSANANVLKALLHVPDRTKYLSQIIKAATYVAECGWRGDTSDKWVRSIRTLRFCCGLLADPCKEHDASLCDDDGFPIFDDAASRVGARSFARLSNTADNGENTSSTF